MEKENERLESVCDFAEECRGCKAEGDYRLCGQYELKKSAREKYFSDRAGI